LKDYKIFSVTVIILRNADFLISIILYKLAKNGGRKILFFLSPLSILVGMFR